FNFSGWLALQALGERARLNGVAAKIGHTEQAGVPCKRTVFGYRLNVELETIACFFAGCHAATASFGFTLSFVGTAVPGGSFSTLPPSIGGRFSRARASFAVIQGPPT